MDMTHFMESFASTFAGVADQVIAYLPRLVAAVVVLLLGWLLARLIRAFTIRLIAGLDQVWYKLISRTGLDHTYLHLVSARLVGEVLFWFVILVSVFGAAQILSFGAVTEWVASAIAYLPSILAGVLIVILGVVLSSLVRSLVVAAATTAHIAQANQLGRAVQFLVVVVAVIVGVTQLGIDVSFLTTITAITLAAIFGGIALAFGLGAKQHVTHILCMQQLRKLFNIGDEIRIGPVEGRILAFTTTMVVVETVQGQAHIPAAEFQQQVVTTTASAEPYGEG